MFFTEDKCPRPPWVREIARRDEEVVVANRAPSDTIEMMDAMFIVCLRVINVRLVCYTRRGVMAPEARQI